MRGREAEWTVVLDGLERTRHGRGGVLLVEGEPGIGKSMLLASATAAAGDRRLSVVSGAGDELSRFTPLAPLLAALPAGLGRAGGAPRVPVQEANIRARLEELASAGPVAAIFDDLHLADPVTLHALRTLPRLLAPYPLCWVLGARGDGRGDDALLFDILQREGATRIRLGPLTDEAETALMADILGAPPDDALRQAVASADGNPAMLTEFLRALVDEGGVAVGGDRASLASPQGPRTLEAVVLQRLGRVTPRTRQLIETGAILGRSFRMEDAAAMLGESPAALLASVEEALASRIVVPTPDAISFQQDQVWHAVTESMPPPVRQALHRQAGEMLMSRLGSAIPAAQHLLVGARYGDPVLLAGLDRAVTEALASAPQAAAEMAVRALELTAPSSGGLPARAVAAVRALAAAARWDEAAQLAQAALAVPMATLETAQLRCSLSSLEAIGGKPADALALAESLLADPGLPGEVRDDAEVAVLQALTGMRDNHRAVQVASAILAQPGGDRMSMVGPLMVLALAMWDGGQAEKTLELAAQAVRAETAQRSPAARFYPNLFLASRLIDLRRYPEADALMNLADRAIALNAVSPSAASPEVLRARMALAIGRLDEAAAEADYVLGHHAVPGTQRNSAMALSILGTVALRRGDLTAARGYMQSTPAPGYQFVSAYESDSHRLVAAEVEEARNGPRVAVDMLSDVYAGLDEHRYLLMSDPVSAPWLVRAALGAGDRPRAEAAEAVMAEIARGNPDVAVYRACAEHARGLLRGDRFSLETAVDVQEDPWARASAAEDLGVMLASVSPRDAVRSLDAALDWHAETGAERDAARIRRRLRRLGVRRRHWRSAKRPPTGWDSLTDTERATTELVAQGLTNQQVADQLYVSVHTVAFHLRQVFRKLGITSRVELARIALEQPADGARPDARRPGGAGGWPDGDEIYLPEPAGNRDR